MNTNFKKNKKEGVLLKKDREEDEMGLSIEMDWNTDISEAYYNETRRVAKDIVSGLELEGVTPQGGGGTLTVQWPIFRRRRRLKMGIFEKFWEKLGERYPFLAPQAPKILKIFWYFGEKSPNFVNVEDFIA